MFKRHYLKIEKNFLDFLLHFGNLHKRLHILEKKNHMHVLNISEGIDPDKWGYSNAWEFLF